MVNFAESLKEERVPEWRDYYVNYSRLKGWINECEQSLSAEAAQNFFDELTLSFERVDQFYNAKEDALVARINQELTTNLDNDFRERLASAIEQDIKNLDSFAVINREALRKIGKKFDKNCLAETGVERLDSGRDTKGVTNWGSGNESLQIRVSDRFENYNFGMSTGRLEKLRVGVQEWKKAGVTASLNKEDLEAPLLDTIKRTTSGVEFGNDLTLTFVSRLKAKWRARYAMPALYFIVVTLLCVVCWFNFAEEGIPAEGPTGKRNKGALDGGSYIVIWVTIITLTLLVWQWPSDHVMLTATLVLNIAIYKLVVSPSSFAKKISMMPV